MSGAIFRVTDGTSAGTVDFFGGPFYLSSWRPSISKYKGGGIFLDSPLSTGRTLAHRVFQNTTERVDLKMRAASDDDAGRHSNLLMDLFEKAAEHAVTGGTFPPVWVEVKSKNETNTRYAIIKKADLNDLENPFAQPFRQTDCTAVMDNLVCVIERGEWLGAPPGTLNSLDVTEGIPDFNLVEYGSFEQWIGTGHFSHWLEYNSPATTEIVTTRAYEGAKSLHVNATSGAYKGVRRDISTGLTSGESYDIKARCLVETGAGSLVAYDGGGFANPVVGSTATREAELLPNTSFETNLDDWGSVWRGPQGNFTASQSSAYAYSGTESLELVVPALGPPTRFHVYASDLVALPSSVTALTFSFAALRSTVAPDTLQIFLEYYNSDGNYVWTATPSLDPEMENTGQWYFYEREYTIPTHTEVSYIKVIIFAMHATTTFTIYLDLFSVKATVPAVDETPEWQELTVTKTASASGIRIGLATNTATGGDVYFDKIELDRVYAPTGSEDGVAFFGPTDINYNLTGIYVADAAVFSDNLLDATLPYALLPDVPADDDAIYFGSAKGPFASVALDLESIIDDPASSVAWEYYIGQWTPIPTIRDTTNGFQVLGKNVVTWYVENDWERHSTGDLHYGYWVRAVISVGSPLSTVVQKNTHPHIVARSYFELDEDQLTGQLRSLMKYKITNESGPTTVRVAEAIAASADDTFADDSGNTLDDNNLTDDLGLDTTIGLRFTSLAIPNRANIVKAALYCKPSAAFPSTSNKQLGFLIQGEDTDDSAAFSTYANFDARTRTSVGAAVTIDTLHFIDNAGLKHAPWGFDKIQGIIQEIVNRTNWATGNDLTLFITDEFNIGGSDYARFEMYDNDASAWVLEVEYLPYRKRFTSAVYMGARSVSRGEDFRAVINTNANRQPDGILISGGNYSGQLLTPALNGSFLPNGEVAVISGSHLSESYDDRIVITITPPLSEQYEGRFRAFIRATLSTKTTEVVRMRLRTQIGSGGSSFTGESNFLDFDISGLVDLGPITVPKMGGADQLNFGIQTLTEDDIAIYLQALILIPIDEWYLEATQPSGSPVALDAETYMEVNSADSTPDVVIASIKDNATTATRSNMLLAGSPASLAPARTQRVWVATTSDVLTDPTQYTKGGLDIHGSHTDMVHKVSVEAVLRYLGMRGAA